MSNLKSFIKSDNGAVAIEYALLAGLIALLLVTALTTLSTGLSAFFGRVNTQVTGMKVGL